MQTQEYSLNCTAPLDEDDCSVLHYRFSKPAMFFSKTIIIYGAGTVGRDYYAQLAKYEQIHIAFWTDRHFQNYSYKYRTVHPITDIPRTVCDYILIAVLKKEISDEIKEKLKTFGIPPEKIVWQEPEMLAGGKDVFPRKKIGRNIIRIQGGLGNQMFQYALYRALNARKIPTEANLQAYASPLERRFELFKVFPNLRMDIDASNDFDAYRNSLNEHKLFKEKEDGVFDADVFKQKDVSFTGYWQSEKYFADIRGIIRRDFIFDVSNPFLTKFADELRQNGNTVAVHVRRGDYLSSKTNIELYSGICTEAYYKKAICFMNEVLQNPQYLVFSDDLVWARENLGIPNAVFITSDLFQNYSNWYDMFLMSCCKHNIIANSSFSWWGAWLNSNPDKIVIAPKRFLNMRQTSDIWCDGWKKI